jgi:Mg2+/Co2+ transporter CorB
MTAERGRALTWIENNLLAILMAIAAAFSGYVTGMTTANHRLDVLEKSEAETKATLERVERNQAGIVRNLDRLNDRLDIEPPQPLEASE